MKMVYEWKQSGRIKVKAQVAGERLERLRKSHGEITPALVVKDAEDESSPLHPAFEWNDHKAAVKWREEQAKFIIRMIVIRATEDEDDTRTIRAFVSVDSDEGEGRAYTSIRVAMADPDKRERLIEEAYDELQDWRKRYNDLREFAAVFAAVDSVSVKTEKGETRRGKAAVRQNTESHRAAS